MSAKPLYFSSATNRFGQAAATSPDSSTICLASSRYLALWDLKDDRDPGISTVIPGHEAHITCVNYLDGQTIVSADEKGYVRVWRRINDQYENTLSIQAHSQTISALCVKEDIVITGSSDALVKIWKYTKGENTDSLEEQQVVDLRGRYPLSIAISVFPGTQVQFLAISGTDTKVQLYLSSEGNFVKSTELAGHEDWVRSLDFRTSSDKKSLVFASGSQDSTIRLWNIEPLNKNTTDPTPSSDLTDEFLDNFEASLGDLGEGEEGGRQISLKRHILTVKVGPQATQQFSVTFDALLVGHEAGVTSISWRDDVASTPTLLSTSTDSSVTLWSPSKLRSDGDDSASIWINRQRFGDVGGQRLGGFVTGVWAQNGKEVLAVGWSGGWRRWRCGTIVGDVMNENWEEAGALTGHRGPVRGLDWSPDGSYLITTGLDQTTRIHAPVLAQNHTSWHEIARPQIHGYDLIDAVFIDRLRFASIGDEKVVRVFEAPGRFVNLAEKLGVTTFDAQDRVRPEGANVPPLGLSNKATIGNTLEVNLGPAVEERRPFESELAGVTLWPEIEKVFGHGYESISIGISHSKKILATACKSTNAEHAVVRVYDIEAGYKPYGEPLSGHVLTVTRIAFSPDDKHILTVSRDRSWRLFAASETGYIPVAADKSHGRIIWDCSWADATTFATASRDKTARVWKQKEGKWSAISTIKLTQPSTAIAFARAGGADDQRRHMAVGLENGEIAIYSCPSDDITNWTLTMSVGSRLAHVDHVYRLAWRPNKEPKELASCSEDGTLRILQFADLN